MPAAPLLQRQSNLQRLLATLTFHCVPDADRTRAAEHAATRLPLCHSTAFGNLQPMLQSGALLSQEQLRRPPGDAEAILGTADDVFLYAAAFSYPDTECGFLFFPSLENGLEERGVATPFDSGALAAMRYVRAPAPYTDGVAFVRDHELPVPDYRALLRAVLSWYKDGAEQYLRNPYDCVCSCDARLFHPFGLIGGDLRAHVFELRIPQRVALEPPRLQAVFVREGFEVSELSRLYDAGIKIVAYAPEDNGSFFYALRESCIDYILQHSLA